MRHAEPVRPSRFACDGGQDQEPLGGSPCQGSRSAMGAALKCRLDEQGGDKNDCFGRRQHTPPLLASVPGLWVVCVCLACWGCLWQRSRDPANCMWRVSCGVNKPQLASHPKFHNVAISRVRVDSDRRDTASTSLLTPRRGRLDDRSRPLDGTHRGSSALSARVAALLAPRWPTRPFLNKAEQQTQ